MWIEKIKLENFRNYTKQEIVLNKGLNVFYGENAQGKTNIIEACFLGSLGKSFRTNKENELIKFNENFTNIEIDYCKSDRKGNVKINIEHKKSVFVNKIKIKKLSDLLGNIHTVIFTPDDINILKDGPESRRRFLNIMISQLRPKYMHMCSLYMKAINERNNYLKKIKNENANENLLDIWDEQLIVYAKNISEYRNDYINKLKNRVEDIHFNITVDKEKMNLKYNTDCLDTNKYKNLLLERRSLDIIKGYTTRGIHRDDFNIYLNDKLVTIYGSQGQKRSSILSLKMAELQVVKDEINETPILLLDDFMSELDEKRRNNFLKKLDDIQIIITCTDKLLLKNNDFKNFLVKNGNIISE